MIWGTVISGVANLVGGYFTGKQEIKKAKVAAELVMIDANAKAIMAEAELKSALAKDGQKYDYDLDMYAMKNMEKSWKDEIVLIIFLAPLIMSFSPSMQPYVATGFQALANTPEWYRYIVIGMVVVIYGMRGMLKSVLQIILKKVGK